MAPLVSSQILSRASKTPLDTGPLFADNSPIWLDIKRKIMKKVERLDYLKASFCSEESKDRIRRKTREAVKSGKLKKLPCEMCGNPRVEAHHPDYTYEHILNVIWLCRHCHNEWHKLFGEEGGFYLWKPS